MGIYDRDYVKESYQDHGGGGTMHMGGGFAYLSPVVKWLLIINFVIFILTLSQNLGTFLFTWGAVYPETYIQMIQVWRLITFQFLHAGPWHLIYNMFVLFFFGPILERLWGSRTFLRFYLISGALGAIVYTLLVLINAMPALPMVGASGGLYAVLMAVAIMFPNLVVLLYGLIPIRMAWLVVLVIILSLLRFAAGENAGGEAAHLTGLAAGALYVLYKPWFTRSRMQRKSGSWKQKMEQEREFEAEVDRILQKVNREGIQSLSEKEKQTLQEATRREQMARHGR